MCLELDHYLSGTLLHAGGSSLSDIGLSAFMASWLCPVFIHSQQGGSLDVAWRRHWHCIHSAAGAVRRRWVSAKSAGVIAARLVGAGGGHSPHHGSIPIGSNLVSHLLGVGVWDRVGQLI
jgi:hypothetical protein